MAGCQNTTLRFILIVFNTVFWLAGVTLTAIGIWFLVDSNALLLLNVAVSNDALLNAAAIITVIIGSLMILIGFLGCCGAYYEDSCSLFIFSTVLLILVSGQITVGILAGIYYDPVVNKVDGLMNETLQSYYFGSWAETAETEAWDYMQVQMSCCGVVGPSDWIGSWWYRNFTNSTQPTWPVPATCCVLTNSDHNNPLPLDSALCSEAALDSNASQRELYLHTQGCKDGYMKWFSNHLAIIIGVSIGLIMVQVIEITCSCSLAMKTRNRGTIA